MKITEKHLKELRQCELYQNILPRYQKNIEWMLKEYIKATEEDNITTKVYFVTILKNDSIEIHSPLDVEVNRRRLLNLSALDFDLNDIENGDICLVKSKVSDEIWLATKEETGFFELDCSYLDSGEGLVVLATMINIETR